MQSDMKEYFKNNLSFWEHLSPEEQDLVLREHQVIKYSQGQLIRGESVDCLGLMLVLKGSLRAFLLSLEGRAITLYRIRAGESCVLSSSCVLEAISFETQIEAETETEVVLFPIKIYSSLLQNNKAVECDSYKIAVERFSEVVAGFEKLVFLNLEQRLVSFLLDESAETASNTIEMTHEQIAIQINSAREAVSRSLKNIASQGLIELFRGGVRLVDKPGLYKTIS